MQVLTSTHLLHSSRVTTTSSSRRFTTTCRVHKEAAKKGVNFVFTSDDKNKTTANGAEMYKNMTPLDEKKSGSPNLNMFEVRDSNTKQTLNHLFYQTPKEEENHTSCVKLPGVGLVCGSEEYLLHETHGCIHAGGVYYALPHDAVHDPTVDITDETYELLDGLSQATFDRIQADDEI
jgi:hypothetical protein